MWQKAALLLIVLPATALFASWLGWRVWSRSATGKAWLEKKATGNRRAIRQALTELYEGQSVIYVDRRGEKRTGTVCTVDTFTEQLVVQSTKGSRTQTIKFDDVVEII